MAAVGGAAASAAVAEAGHIIQQHTASLQEKKKKIKNRFKELKETFSFLTKKWKWY